MAKKDIPKETNLAGCGYRVAVSDGLIVFIEDEPVFGCQSRFAFSRNSARDWVFENFGHPRVHVSHLLAAWQFVKKYFGPNPSETE